MDNKKIEKLEYKNSSQLRLNKEFLDKINEIIDFINEQTGNKIEPDKINDSNEINDSDEINNNEEEGGI